MLHDFLLPDGHSLFFFPFRTVPVPVFPHVPAVVFPDVLPAAFPLLTALAYPVVFVLLFVGEQVGVFEFVGGPAAPPGAVVDQKFTKVLPVMPDASSLPLPRFDAHSAVDAQTFEPDVFPVCDCCF